MCQGLLLLPPKTMCCLPLGFLFLFQAVLEALKAKGHEIQFVDPTSVFQSTSQFIKNTCALCPAGNRTCADECRLEAASDGRRYGSPDGF